MALEKNIIEKLNPFPGLRSFTTAESEYFFGRESESNEIVEKLIKNRFVAVIGALGTGKSSLIRCGIIPAVTKLSEAGSAGWNIGFLTPGRDPFDNLADVLLNRTFGRGQKNSTRGEITGLLKQYPDGISRAIKKISPENGKSTLIVIDQFEELFRYTPAEKENAAHQEITEFINLLTKTITGNFPGLAIILAVQTDSLYECAQYKDFTKILNNSNFFIPSMTWENFREVITGPVKKAGAEIDTDLVDLLIHDVADRPGYLPVLQHTLMRTWARWQVLDEPDRPLNYSDYISVGTIRNSVSLHADEVYQKLSTSGKMICERLFKAIAGKNSDNKGIRYPADVKTLRSIIRCNANELLEVIDTFRDPSVSFLTPLSDVTLDDNSVIDLSNEGLIILWDRLKKWVDEEAASVQMYLHLSEASALYQQGKAVLLKQPDLQLAIKWREQNKPTVWWARKYDPAFERAMVFLRTSEKEYFEEEERKKLQSRWKLKRIRIMTSFLGGIAIVAALSMMAAFWSKISSDIKRKEVVKQNIEISDQKRAAEEYATLAIRKIIKADSSATVALNNEQKERNRREAAEKRTDSVSRVSLLSERNAKTATGQKVEAQRLRMISLAKSMSLRSIQASSQKDIQALLAYQAFLFNKRNNGQPNDADIYMGLYEVAKQNNSDKYKSFNGHSGNVKSIAFVPGSEDFFTSGSDGLVLKWNLDNKEKSYQVIYSDNEIIDVLAVSPKADWLACAKENAGIRMIPLGSNDISYELKGHTGKIKSLIFSFDGRFLYSAGLDGKVLKWDLVARTAANMSTDNYQITSIDMSSDGKYLAGVSTTGKALVWNPDRDSDKFSIGSEDKVIRSIKFKPGEELVAVGYEDGSLELWLTGTRRKISEIRAHNGEVSDIRFNPRHSQMATSGDDGSLKIWDNNDLTNAPITFNDNEGLVISFEFSPDGAVLISGNIGVSNNLVARPTYADAFAPDGCLYVSRNFTPDEWLAYVGKDISYEPTCPGKEYKIKIREIR